MVAFLNELQKVQRLRVRKSLLSLVAKLTLLTKQLMRTRIAQFSLWIMCTAKLQLVLYLVLERVAQCLLLVAFLGLLALLKKRTCPDMGKSRSTYSKNKRGMNKSNQKRMLCANQWRKPQLKQRAKLSRWWKKVRS